MNTIQWLPMSLRTKAKVFTSTSLTTHSLDFSHAGLSLFLRSPRHVPTSEHYTSSSHYLECGPALLTTHTFFPQISVKMSSYKGHLHWPYQVNQSYTLHSHCFPSSLCRSFLLQSTHYNLPYYVYGFIVWLSLWECSLWSGRDFVLFLCHIPSS